jgi:SAM-dependent methyltransferase
MEESVSCPACAERGMQVFFRLESVPSHQNAPLPTWEMARQCDRGDIVLGFCPACGFIANLAFEPARLKYSPEYDNAQFFSPLFRTYMESLAAHLVNQYNLYNKTVIEIGCGQGEFLNMVCKLGHNRGIGFDPSYAAERGETFEQVTFVQDFYSERYADYQGDMICARHFLEHIQHPAELVAGLQRSIKDRSDTVVFFEVPDVAWILRNLAFWDIFYEHCSYFNPGSLARLFTQCGFKVIRVAEAFGAQYLWLEAFPRNENLGSEPAGPKDQSVLADMVTHFATNCYAKMEAMRGRVLGKTRQNGRRGVIWGAGAKGVTILNSLGIGLDHIEFVVDINPRKQGLYVPGTGQQIVSPDFLRGYRPDVVFIVNPNYLAEIQNMVAALNISPELILL